MNRLILSNTKNLAAGVTSDIPTVANFEGAWFYKQPATIDGIVYDERRGLGTARPVQPRRAMLLNGTNQYVVHTRPSPITAYPFTLFGWGKKTGTASRWAMCLGDVSNSARYLACGFDDGDTVLIGRRNTTEVSNSAVVSSVSGWYSFAFVFVDATTVLVYRNGSLLHTFSGLTSVTLSGGFGSFGIGTFRLASPSTYWDGHLQHCGYTLTAATLADALAFHQTGIMPNAERQFLLDDNSTTVARDIITGAEASTVNGAAGMLYTGRDVPFSRQNDVGYSLRTNLLTHTNSLVGNGWASSLGVTGTQVGTETRLDNLSAGDGDEGWRRLITISPATVTFSVTVRAEGANIGKTLRVRLKRSGGTFVSSNTNTVLTALPQRVSVSMTMLGDNTGVSCIFTDIADGLDQAFVSDPQLEVSPIATDYQSIGTDPGSSVLFPAILNGTTSAAGDPLQFTGPVPMNGQAQQANAFTFDGSDDYIQLPLNDYAGPELVTNGALTTNTTGWTPAGGVTLSIESGRMKALRTSGSDGPYFSQALNVVAGRAYCFGFESFSDGTSVPGRVFLGTAAGNSLRWGSDAYSHGVKKFVYVSAKTETIHLWIYPGATGINSYMLIDNVFFKELSLLSPNTVTFSNGTFDTDTIWTKGTGWTIGSGVATFAATGSESVLTQAVTLTPGRQYLITYNLTRSAGGLSVRLQGSGASASGSLKALTESYTEVLTAVSGNNTLAFVANTTFAGTVDNVTIQELGSIPHSGTSVLSYRLTADGITGTAGTAYDIRLGNVGWIPCSEGGGQQVHDVIQNTALSIINGQSANWFTKQNTFHYSLKHGYNLTSQSERDADMAEIYSLLKVSSQPVAMYLPWANRMIDLNHAYAVSSVPTFLDVGDGLYNATQATPDQRSAWGRVPKSGRVNLLIQTNNLEAAIWTKGNSATVTANVDIAPDGTLTADQINLAESELSRVQQALTGMPTATYTFSLWMRVVSGSVSVRFGQSNDLDTVTVTDVWQRFTSTKTVTAPGQQPNITIRNESGGGVKTIFAWGGQIETGSTATNYQTVTTAFDITEPGQTSCYYLQPDGVNDGYVTGANLDMSGTDKVTVFAAVRKLSDAAVGVIAELSPSWATNNGAFSIQSASGSGANFASTSRGNAAFNANQVAIADSISAPATRVLTGILSIGDDVNQLRVNGVLLASATGDQGSGNYRNDLLYLFRRGGTTAPFNGQCFALIVAGGSYSTATIQRVEQILSKYTPGVTL